MEEQLHQVDAGVAEDRIEIDQTGNREIEGTIRQQHVPAAIECYRRIGFVAPQQKLEHTTYLRQLMVVELTLGIQPRVASRL